MKWYYDYTVVATGKKAILGPFDSEVAANSERSVAIQNHNAHAPDTLSFGLAFEAADDYKEQQPIPIARKTVRYDQGRVNVTIWSDGREELEE